MEESYELLSSMSPKIRGGQKTLKVKKASVLALKKHFRRSSVFDKSHLVRNEDLSVIELNSCSSESIASFKEIIPNKDENDIVVINLNDSEEQDNFPKKMSSKCSTSNDSESKNMRIQQWLYGIEEDKKSQTFFSQVSTIIGDDPTNFDNDGNKIAASSTLNDCLNHRFDELFIAKKNDMENQPKEDISDDSFSLDINTSLTSKLKKFNSSKNNNINSENPQKNKLPKNQVVISESLLTSDESASETSPPEFRKATPPQWTPNNLEYVSVRKKNDYKITPQDAVTPKGQNVQEVKSLLDSFYGKKWRKNQECVLQPMSEPRKKDIGDKRSMNPNTEKVAKPKLKDYMLDNLKPATKKLNFDRIMQPVQSPWAQKLKGLVDSDSDNNTETGHTNDFKQSRGLDMVKMKLEFKDDSPKEVAAKTKKNSNREINKAGKNKENNGNNANRELPKTLGNIANRNIKKNTETRSSSSSSTKTCGEEDVSTDDEYDKEIQILDIKRKSMMPIKHKTCSFLESLSGCVPMDKCDVSAKIFRTSYKEYKNQLAKKLFTFFNEKVFDNAIPNDTELEWNTNLRKTAGLCHCKKITHRNGNVQRKVKISLSTKVLDSANRLRDTLIHEMCHAVTWIVNKVSDGHGPYWKSWAFKAMETFPELPPIKRCHTYTINSKYTYKCTSCGYSFGRHSKSLDTERKRCGLCYGKFEVLLNKTTKNGETKTVSVTPRKEPTGFALFVKENYALYKEPSKKHGEVMKILGQKFAELKVKNTS